MVPDNSFIRFIDCVIFLVKKYLQTYNKKKTPVCNIDIVGFSRGAIAAVRFAEKVKSISTEYNIKHIRFAGLFDPVEGGMRDATTTKMNSFVRYAAIAYSITESRDVFQPTYYYPEVPENVFRYDPAIRSDRYVRPLFFWGGHSDVGGGYKDRGLSNITLGWMIQEGIRAGAPFSTAGLNAHIVNNGFTHIVHRKQEDKFFYTHSHRVFPYWARSHSSVFKYSNGFLPKLP